MQMIHILLPVLGLICFSEASPVQKNCTLQNAEKEDCGYYGIKEKECVKDNGCCWVESNIPNTPWCFSPRVPTTTPRPAPTPRPTEDYGSYEYGSGGDSGSDEEDEGCPAPFLINSLSKETPEGYKRPNKAVIVEHLDDVRSCLDVHGEWAILLIEGGKLMGSGYGYAFEDNSGGAGSELLIEDNDIPLADVPQTPGCDDPYRVVFISDDADMPTGYRRASENEVRGDMDTVKGCLDTQGRWAILLIEGGKVMGSGYDYNIEYNEGGAGWMLIVPQ